jgi:hypothetical protein
VQWCITRTNLIVEGNLVVPSGTTLIICSKLNVTGTIINNGIIRISKTPGAANNKLQPELVYAKYIQPDKIIITTDCKINGGLQHKMIWYEPL